MNQKKISDEFKLNHYPKNRDLIPVAVIYPGPYHTAMSSLGYHTLYDQIDKFPFLKPLRFGFTENEFSAFDGHKISVCRAAFITSNFEFEYLNLFKISKHLKSLKIFSILGGMSVHLSDLVFMKYFDRVYKNQVGVPFYKLLKQLPDIIYDHVKSKAKSSRLINGPVHPDFTPCSAFLSTNTVFRGQYLIEVSSGCHRSCRFCLLSTVNKPPSLRPYKEIRDLIFAAKDKASALGFKSFKAGLISAALTDWEGHMELMKTLISHKIPFNTSSLRMEQLTSEHLKLLKQNGQKTLTLAPETASYQLKKNIGKNYSQEILYDLAYNTAVLGFAGLKLYYMIGLPEETQEDIIRIAEDIKNVHKSLKKGAGKSKIMPQLKISINPFIPKPLTAFERFPFENTISLKKKIKILKKEIGQNGYTKLNTTSSRLAAFQYILANQLDAMEPLLNDCAEHKRPLSELIRLVLKSDFIRHRETF